MSVRQVLLFCLTCFLVILLQDKLIAQPAFEYGQNKYRQGQYQEAIILFQSALERENSPILQHYLGKSYQKVGKFSEAIIAFRQAAQGYRKEGNKASYPLAVVLIELAQSYLELGQLSPASTFVGEALTLTQQIEDTAVSAAAYGTQGNILFLEGKWEEALNAYSRNFQLAPSTVSLNQLTQASIQLAQYYDRQAEYAEEAKNPDFALKWREKAELTRQKAQDYARKALNHSQAQKDSTRVRALFNALPYQTEEQRTQSVEEALSLLQQLPNSRAKVYQSIELAPYSASKQELVLQQAVQSATTIGDSRGLSFALIKLGQMYYENGDYALALPSIQKAQLAAQEAFAFDLLYRTWWQKGRIQLALGNLENAKDAYRKAIATLGQIRGDLAKEEELQFDFSQQIEPIYREYLTLLLEDGKSNPEQLKEALSVFQLLQKAELENFFQDVCLEGTTRSFTDLLAETQTVAITSITLSDRLHLLLQFPDGSLSHVGVSVAEQTLIEHIKQWRNELEDPFSNNYLMGAQALYNWLFKPVEKQIQSVHPRTLLFINDGVLRNIPMTALYDGSQYLIEKYNMTNSLGLTPSTAQFKRNDLLSFGLSVAVAPFPALPNVELETEIIQETLGGERFLNDQFTAKNLARYIDKRQPSILHLATHGQFNGTLKQTFLQAYDRTINLSELEDLLNQTQQPIELLTLSACETAAGNERSVLGLAGVALRSTTSVVGSLWSVNDDSTLKLIQSFYENLKRGLTKPEALRQAQITLIQKQGSHPHEWGSFSLFGF